MQSKFTPVRSGQMNYLKFAQSFTVKDLRRATHESIDFLLTVLDGLSDAQVVFLPNDPKADDPYAVKGEETIGWSIAHLIAHVTASSEEGAAISSSLARGIAVKLRPRYETPWREIQTVEQCIQRLEESRRMRLAFLDTWPDEPHLDVYRKVSQEFIDKFGPMNAPAAVLFGISHEVGHFAQFEEVRQQALDAVQRV